MSHRFECGLVVGKFAPLHRGHQHLIDTALSQCRHVVLLSYSNPEFPGCDPERREHWLKALYPQTTRVVVSDGLIPPNDDTDDVHRAFTAKVLRRTPGREVDAVFTSESYGDGFAAYLDSYFRSHNPSAKPVRHVLVDPARAAVPTSGTSIRNDVHAAREWLHPAVYASFVDRVVCLGGESSGKSTLAAALASEFRSLHAPEFGREWWVERGGNLQFDDLLFIAQRQVEREQRLAGTANRYLFCDTSPLTTLFYCLDQFGEAAAELQALAERRYAFTILCAPDFDFVQDGTRREPEFRLQQHEWYVRQLQQRRIRYLEVHGSVEARVDQVAAELRRL